MTASIERHARERLALPDPAEGFIGACNIAKLRTPRPVTVQAALVRLRSVTKDQSLDAEGNLQHFISGMIHFAAVTRSAELIEVLVKLLVELAEQADATLMNSIVHNILECASVSVVEKTSEQVFTQYIRRVISACSNADAAVQIHHLLSEIVRHRPGWRTTLAPLIAASELAT